MCISYIKNNRTVNTNSVTSKYPGGQIANHYCANGSNNGNEKYIGKTCWVTAYSGTNSNYASGGNLYNGTQAGPNNHWYPAWDEYSSWGQYLNSGGGGSWGAGGSCDGSMRNGQRAGIGGGAIGFNYFVANNGKYSFDFSGGQGGEVNFDYVDVTPSETIAVVVGAKGVNPAPLNYPVYFSDMQKIKGKDGGAGGDSYLARSNGQIITQTVARGGNGGSGQLVYKMFSSVSTELQGIAPYPVYYHYGGGIINNDKRDGGGTGAALAIRVDNGYNNSNNGSQAGYSGQHAISTRDEKTSTNMYGPAGVYNYGAGGGSWGDGCDPVNLVDAGIGGGGCAGATHQGNGIRQAGDGLVNIKAIGTVYY